VVLSGTDTPSPKKETLYPMAADWRNNIVRRMAEEFRLQINNDDGYDCGGMMLLLVPLYDGNSLNGVGVDGFYTYIQLLPEHFAFHNHIIPVSS
jgi:hypothetical protein